MPSEVYSRERFSNPLNTGVDSVVCIRNHEAKKSLALENCHIGQVLRIFKLDKIWYCLVRLYLRPKLIPLSADRKGLSFDEKREVLEDIRCCISTFELDDIFSECEIVTGNCCDSVDSILKTCVSKKPAFALRFQLEDSKTSKFCIKPYKTPTSMAQSISDVLLPKVENAKILPVKESDLKEGKATPHRRKRGVSQEEELSKTYEDVKENVSQSDSSLDSKQSPSKLKFSRTVLSPETCSLRKRGGVLVPDSPLVTVRKKRNRCISDSSEKSNNLDQGLQVSVMVEKLAVSKEMSHGLNNERDSASSCEESGSASQPNSRGTESIVSCDSKPSDLENNSKSSSMLIESNGNDKKSSRRRTGSSFSVAESDVRRSRRSNRNTKSCAELTSDDEETHDEQNSRDTESIVSCDSKPSDLENNSKSSSMLIDSNGNDKRSSRRRTGSSFSVAESDVRRSRRSNRNTKSCAESTTDDEDEIFPIQWRNSRKSVLLNQKNTDSKELLSNASGVEVTAENSANCQAKSKAGMVSSDEVNLNSNRRRSTRTLLQRKSVSKQLENSPCKKNSDFKDSEQENHSSFSDDSSQRCEKERKAPLRSSKPSVKTESSSPNGEKSRAYSRKCNSEERHNSLESENEPCVDAKSLSASKKSGRKTRRFTENYIECASEIDDTSSEPPAKRLRSRSTDAEHPRSQCPEDIQRTPTKSSKVSNSKTPLKSPKTPRGKTPTKSPKGSFTPSMPNRASAPSTPVSNLEQVRKNLHVSAVPLSLPCREMEYRNIYNFIENKIRDDSSGCMYISGVPGTGKTATVHAVIRSLQELADQKKLKHFKYIEVNGLRMTEPRQVFVQVLRSLTGQKCSPQQARDILAQRFCSGSRKKETVVLLVDEVDMLRNRRQDVIYNLFDWPSKPNSHFVVLTIANTMDLPERLLKGRVTSRLGLTRLVFQPYTHKQLQAIVLSRLQGSDSFNDDAIELVSRKVAAYSGDVRRALDICRRASELVEDGSPVTMPIVTQVISKMMNSANVCSIKACSMLEKIFLQAVVAENERTGVEETTFIAVYRQFQSLCILASVSVVHISEAMAILCRLGTSGLLLTEHSRSDINQSIFLNVSADDIHYSLKGAS